MSKRFGRRQKRKAIQLAKDFDYLKGRYCEVVGLIGGFIGNLSPEELDYITQADTGDRVIMYQDGVNVSLNRVNRLLSGRGGIG